MDVGRWKKPARFAVAIVACLPALWQIGLLLRLYISRVGYPVDIEWLEGAALYQAFRVMVGQATYGPPQMGYLPLFHPPVYPTFLGLLGRLVGLDYAMARTVSLLFFAGGSALLVREIRRAEKGRVEGWTLCALAIGCAAAGVPFFEGFYDMVREDIMSVFLCVLGAVLAEPREMKPRRIALLAAVLTLALYARFPTVFFLLWIVLFAFARHRRTGVLLALTLASACGVTLVVLQYVTRGWFWMYTVTLLQDHQVLWSRFLLGMRLIFQFAPYIALIPVVGIILAIQRRLSARALLWTGMLLAAFPAALLPFSKVGGFSNDFMPIAFLAGPAAMLVASDAFDALRSRPRAAALARYLTYAGFAAYLVVRHYDVKRFVPNADGWRQATSLSKRVRELEGGVVVPRHPFLAIRNGHRKTQQFADMPFLDAYWADFVDLSLGPYLDKIHARWAVVTGTEIPYSAAEIATRYQLEGPIGEAPQMIIGERSLVKYLLRWNDAEENARVLFDFEDPSLPGWTTTGDAFSIQSNPVLRSGRKQIAGVIGERFASSYHPAKNDAATGTLASPAFTIDRPKMSLRVGGSRAKTRVELRVDGQVKKTAIGIFQYTETMTRIVWDVSTLQGQRAQLVLIDEDTGAWGHLLCDQVVLY